jgi:2-polyprenyl-6-methoxyphenol hydroxylase-like FAD-dependent oxidoreductase
MATPTRPSVIVVGGSIAGLFAGVCLRRLGFRVDVFERSRETLASRGAGIVTHPELFEALAAAGIRLDAALGVQVGGRVTLHQNGRVLASRDLPQTLTSWDRVFRFLREAFPNRRYHQGSALVDLIQDDVGVTARFAGGAVARADWLIGADGLRSAVRARLMPNAAATYSGYVAWRGLVPDGALSAATRAAIGDRFAFCLPPGEQMLGYPVPGADEEVELGRRRYNSVWYRAADAARELPRLLTDARGRHHPHGIPPAAIDPTVVAEMRAAGRALLAPQFQEVVALTREPFLQAIYDLESPRMVLGRIVLIGDAAFVARPHAGLGVTKAALDAVALARALAAPDPGRTLAAFERDRLAYGRAVVARARRLGAFLQQPRRGQGATPAALLRMAERLMAETASSEWLAG